MGDKTGIQWTDATWNPIVGCSILSAGCRGCYAMGEAARLERMGVVKYCNLTTDTKVGPVWNGNVALDERSLEQPMRWRRSLIIFVNSMSDLFHEALTDTQIDQVFAVMALSPTHTFQVVTKRSARMRAYTTDPGTPDRIAQAALLIGRDLRPGHPGWSVSNWRRADGSIVPIWPLPNLWMGVTVEDQDAARARLDDLDKTPAVLRFVSAEPLLEEIDLQLADCDGFKLRSIDWVIVGGESGPRARTCNVEWITDVMRQCRNAAIPVFVKQLGARFIDEKDFIGGAAVRLDKDVGRDLTCRLKHRKGADITEWPEYLRVRQMPACRRNNQPDPRS